MFLFCFITFLKYLNSINSCIILILSDNTFLLTAYSSKLSEELLFPVGFILWYLAYEAKPIINDEVKLNWEDKNTIKRNKLLNIINESF